MKHQYMRCTAIWIENIGEKLKTGRRTAVNSSLRKVRSLSHAVKLPEYAHLTVRSVIQIHTGYLDQAPYAKAKIQRPLPLTVRSEEFIHSADLRL